MKKYTASEISAKLVDFNDWKLDDGSLTKTFTFKDFSEAFAFTCRVALIAESLGHHPDWSGVYNKVTIKLNTHEVGGITDKDFAFVERVDAL